MTAVVAETEPVAAGEPAPDTDALEAEAFARRRRRRLTTICVLTYAVLAVLAFLPTAPFATREFPAAGPHNPAGSDPFQMAWFLEWFPYAVTHGLNVFHTTQFDYPGGVNLADNTSVPLLGLIAWPITSTLGPVASFNFLLRLAFALSGVSMFLVLRRWCTTTIAPFLGGLLYAFGPYMAGQELHLDLTFVPLPPLLVLLGDELLRRRRMKPMWLGLGIGACTAAQLLISPDVLSGCLVLVLGTGLVLGVRHRHELRARSGYLLATGAFAAAVFGVIAGYPIWEMIAGPSHVTGPVIPIAALQNIHADLIGPIIPTANQLLAPPFIARLGNEMVTGNLSENVTLIGVPLLILLVVIVRRLRGDTAIRAFAWLAGAAFVISLGSELTFATLTSVIPMPEAIFQRVPLLDDTIPARYGLYVALFTAMIMAIGIERLWLRRGSGATQQTDAAATAAEVAPSGRRWLEWRPRLGPLGADTPRARHARIGVVGGIVALSLVPNIPFTSHQIPWPASLAPTVERVVPAGAVVLTYPFATPLHPDAMLWEASAGMNYHLIGGYANIEVDSAGQRWPVLLEPEYVQELLGLSNFGDRWPLPGAPTAADVALLPVYLNRYSVGAVVYWNGGDNPVVAYNYIREALGRPYLTKHGFTIWLPTKGHWVAPIIRR
jgi:hypothetical protein